MIYGLPLMLQEREITAHCFGDCGHAAIGGIDGGIAGPCVPCTHDECPHEERCTPVVGKVFGEDFKVRKLKPLDGREWNELP